FLLLLFFALRVLLRREWLAVAAFVVVFSFNQINDPWIATGFDVLRSTLFLANILRFGGLLPTLTCGFVGYVLARYPLTTDFSSWYSSYTILAVTVVLTLAVYACHIAVANRPLFKGGFLESD